jgi:hypothetical protein
MDDVKTTMSVGDGPELPIDLNKDIDDPANADAKEAMAGVIGEALGKTGVSDLAADTLRGDVRDALLADSADRCARQLVKQACRIIAASERPCIVAQLVEYKEKDGVEAKLKLPSKGEVVAALHEACGREVLVVTSGEEEFQGEAAPAEITKDQPELGIGAEYEEAA